MTGGTLGGVAKHGKTELLSFRADLPAGQVKTRDDHARVAQALLPVLASFRRTLLHRQECLCHKILNSFLFATIFEG